MKKPPANGWTRDQERAMDFRGEDLLISAAAGSGKTAVLVERVIRRLTDKDNPIDVDRLLVVTFTEAAASEMRGRIEQALRTRAEQAARTDPEEASRLRRQTALLGRAAISTLHSFCLSVCRRYFDRLGIDPGFEILSKEEADLLQREVLDGLLERFYEREDPGFLDLVEALGSERNDDSLRQAVLDLHAFAESHPDPERWLDESAAAFEPPPGARLRDRPFGRAVIQDVSLSLMSALEDLQQAEALTALPGGPAPYGPDLAENTGRLAVAIRRLGAEGRPWDDCAEALREAADFPRLPSVKKGTADEALKDSVKTLRDRAKAAAKDLAAVYGARTEASFLDEIRRMAGRMRQLAWLVASFRSDYRRAKDERATVDFGDLEHLCLQALTGRLDTAPAGGEPLTDEPTLFPAARPASGEPSPPGLVPSDAALDLRRRFEEVLVDEYQDINEVQEALLSLVARKGRLFVVGDVKQSIYRFRLADPGLFKAKSETFRPLSEKRAGEAGVDEAEPGVVGRRPAGRKVNLAANFRSRKAVIDAVNYVFGRVMRSDAAELDYDNDARLVYGATCYNPRGAGDPSVELHLLEAGPERHTGGEPGWSGDGGGTDSAGNGDDGYADDRAGGSSPGDADSSRASDGEVPLEDLQVVEREACVMARRIRELVEGPAPLRVWDKGAKRRRAVRYRDIVVLMRATTGLANQVIEIFGRFGVPAYAELSVGYFQATEVETALSILRVIDNPRQDIPLAAVLRSPVVGCDENDLARIRLARRDSGFYDAVIAASAIGRVAGEPGTPSSRTRDGDAAAEIAAVPAELAERLCGFLALLDDWRTAARRGPLSELVWRLFGETGYYAYVGGLPNGGQRQANLRALHDRARLFDRFSRQGLARFLKFIDRLRESEGDLGPPPPLGEGEDAVRVMSIHRSKGLEFPVVFLAHLGKRFNLSDTRGDLLLHRDLGFGPKVIDTARRLKYPSLANLAVSVVNRFEAVAEEMRCLYVAMTRARECLILVGSKKDLSRGLGGWCRPARDDDGLRLTAARVARASSYLDWIVPAVAGHPAAEGLLAVAGLPAASPSAVVASPGLPKLTLRLWGLPGYEAVRTFPDEAAQPGVAGPKGLDWDRVLRLEPLPGVPAGSIAEALDWSYPQAWSATLPAKVAPTELKRLRASGFEEEASTGPAPGLPDSSTQARHPEPLRPAFLQTAPRGLTAAERGKATHLLLQHADLGGPLDEDTLTGLAAALADREIMTPERAEGADVKTVAEFFTSDLGRWLVANRSRVRREVPFTLGLPAGEVFGKPAAPNTTTGGAEPRLGARAADDTVLVQGIIDALVDEPDGVTIVDFKTDRVTADEVPARAEAYRTQVDLYRRAVETIWGRPVKKVCLYFLTPGVAAEVGRRGDGRSSRPGFSASSVRSSSTGRGHPRSGPANR